MGLALNKSRRVGSQRAHTYMIVHILMWQRTPPLEQVFSLPRTFEKNVCEIFLDERAACDVFAGLTVAAKCMQVWKGLQALCRSLCSYP